MPASHHGNVLLRLTDMERQKLQLVTAALRVSEYSDEVDVFARVRHNDESMVSSMVSLFDTITGLAIASDAVPRSIKEVLLVGNTNIAAMVPLLEEFFEIFRRHKHLNSLANREEYGKLMMLLQDVQRGSIQKRLGISSSLVLPLQTVGGALRRVGCEELLVDPQLQSSYLRASGREKQAGLAALVDRHAGLEDNSKRAVVERCLLSIDDAQQLIATNVRPLVELQQIILDEFKPMEASGKYALAIGPANGANLCHTHAQQCQYVLESLRLWELVQRKIFSFWHAAEYDMVNEGSAYRLVNTGQGFHRMYQAPRSYEVTARCVQEAERQMNGWVGIKVIHLGDDCVPNPLVFIDKYTVIPRLVQPIVQTIHTLRDIFGEKQHAEAGPSLSGAENYPGLGDLLRRKYHSYDELRMMILSDFFKFGFDGSGDKGGNCIDGRLTSAWNWCSKVDKKPFYDAFVLTGFTGFD